MVSQWISYDEAKHKNALVGRRAVVALGGGGARGLAHLGAMEVIGDSGVRTERIVGVSMGGLVGALCAVELDFLSAQTKAIELLKSPTFHSIKRRLFGQAGADACSSESGFFAWYRRIRDYLIAHQRFSRAITASSLINQTGFRALVEQSLPDIDLRETKIPFCVVCADLLSGNRVVLDRGPLRTAVMASASLPGIFPPVPWEGMLLCDIGVVDSLPTAIARGLASDLTIGVDVGRELQPISSCTTALDVMMRMQDIGENLLRKEIRCTVDINIRPTVGDLSWFDFNNPEDVIACGRQAASESIDIFKQQNSLMSMEFLGQPFRF